MNLNGFMNQWWVGLTATVWLVMFSWMGQVSLFHLQTDSLDELRHRLTADSGIHNEALLTPDVRLLQQASQLESPYIGAAGSPSKQHQALQNLMSHEASESMFMALLADVNPVAQLYGLMGLQQTRSEHFAAYLPFFEHSQHQVHVLAGCAASIESVSEVQRLLKTVGRLADTKKGVYVTRPVLP